MKTKKNTKKREIANKIDINFLGVLILNHLQGRYMNKIKNYYAERNDHYIIVNCIVPNVTTHQRYL